MIPVAWREPFSLGDAYRDLRPCGESIGEIVRSIPTLPPGFPGRGVVCVNGEPVPRVMWDHVRPKTSTADLPVIVTLHYPLAGGGDKGGGGAKSVIALVAAVALTALTGGIAGGLAFGTVGGLFAAGSLSAQLLAGAVGIAGALLISAISAPPTVKAKNDSIGEDNRGAASADGNVISPAGAITRVIGTRRVFPALATDPIIELYPGGDQYVEACYILNGPHLVEDIRLGESPIEDAEDVEFELREGWGDDEPVTLTARQGRQTNVQTEMSTTTMSPEDQQRLLHPEDPEDDLPVWHGFSSAVNPDEVWLHLSMPGGLYLQSDTTNDKSVAFRVRARPRGSGTWINFPEFHYSGRSPTQRKLAVLFKWEAWPGAFNAIPTRNAFIYATRVAPAQTVSPLGTAWTANTYFDDGVGNNYVYTGQETGTRLRNMSLYEERVEFFLDEATFPRGGIWEFEIKRSSPFDTSSFTKTNYQYAGTGDVYDFFSYTDASGVPETPMDRTDIVDTVGMTLVQSIWNEHPIAGAGLCVIAIRALNKRVESLSAMASGYVRDWDGSGWNTWTTTSNPAPHYADILSGLLNLDPLPDDLRDDDGLVAWRTLCEDNGWNADILVEDMRIEDILGLLASCGYARPYQSEVYGVTVDKDHTDDDIVQMFSPRNSSNFRSEKSFVRLPDGFIVTFRDMDQNYEQAQVIVYSEGYSGGPGGLLEAVTYDGIVDEDKVRIRAKFDLDQAELRSTFHYLDTDMEAIVCRKGDLVVVQHDVISKRAGSALVKSLVATTDSITGLVLDSVIPVYNETDMHGVTDMHSVTDMHMVGLTTGVAIRHNDGTFTVHQVSDSTGETDTVTLVTPVTDDGTIDALEDTEYISGAQLVCGGMETIYSRLLVAELSPERDMTYRLTLVDEAPELVRA